jgi:hypothetical protein
MSLYGSKIVIVEAGTRSGVAGRADLVDTNEQRVTVTVQGDGLDVLHMTRGVALAPVLAAASRPECHPTRRQGAMKCLIVHPADHENLAAVVLLHDGTDKTTGVALQTRGDRRVEGGLR